MLFTYFLLAAIGICSALEQGWEKIHGSLSETRCAWGNPWHFFYHQGQDPEKLVIFFEGGGACWDAESCRLPIYYPIEMPPYGHSFFNFTNPTNPVANYSFLFIPYCTGDAHLGTQTKQFNGSEKIHFWGRKNFMYALRWYEEQISKGNAMQPTKVLTSGCSAGSVGSYINILISKKIFPLAKHYHWGDSFLPIFGKDAWDGAWTAWPFSASLPDNMDKNFYAKWRPLITVEMMSDLQDRFGLAYHSSAHDHDLVETAFYILGGMGAGPSWHFYANKTLNAMHRLSKSFGSFMYPGVKHCSSDQPEWLDMECEGWHLNTWIDAWLNDKPFPKVISCKSKASDVQKYEEMQQKMVGNPDIARDVLSNVYT